MVLDKRELVRNALESFNMDGHCLVEEKPIKEGDCMLVKEKGKFAPLSAEAAEELNDSNTPIEELPPILRRC